MIRPRFSSILLRFCYLSMLALLLAPLYMYFSDDVEELKTLYPHLMTVEPEARYDLRASRPKTWVSLTKISSYAKGAIVISEDWGFYQHDGIDVAQMKAALREMVDERRFRGASTITQQMVKNVFLSHSRTLWRKVHEMILAQKVEKVLTKDRILEVYLNCIEFGPKVYGIKNAANFYFHKSPAALSPREGAFLAMLLPSPIRYSVSFKQKKLTVFARARINTILAKMRMGKIISSETFIAQKNSKFSWEKY